MNYKKDRQDLGYLPSDHEHLSSYVDRLRDVLQQNRYAYAPKHENWYTHYGSAPCWICNFMDISDYLCSVLQDMVEQDKTRTWKCKRPQGQTDPLAFVFIPHKK